jgi:hypothetical protein
MSHQDDNAQQLGPLVSALDREQQILQDIAEIVNTLVDFARLGVAGRPEDTRIYARRFAHQIEAKYPELAAKLKEIAGPGNILRDEEAAILDGEHTHGIRNRKTFIGKKADCPYCTGSLKLDLSEVAAASNCDQNHESLRYHFSACPACGLTLQDEEAL